MARRKSKSKSRRLGSSPDEHSKKGAVAMREAVDMTEEAQKHLKKRECRAAVLKIAQASANAGEAMAHQRSGGSVDLHNVDFLVNVRKAIIDGCVRTKK